MSNIILIRTSPNQDSAVERTIKVVEQWSSSPPAPAEVDHSVPVRPQDIKFHLPSPTTTTSESSTATNSPIPHSNTALLEKNQVDTSEHLTPIVPKCLIRRNHEYCITWSTRMGADDIDFSFHPSDFDSDDDL